MWAGIGKGGGLMPSILNGDDVGSEGGAARMMWLGEPGAFGVGGVLQGSELGVSATPANTARVVSMSRRSLLDKVRCGFIPCPFSTIAVRKASCGERMYASWMFAQKRTKASALLS